jgi:Flp pilus assembly protein TadG
VQSSQKRKAATVVEFAAVSMVFLMLMFGMLEYCVMMYTYQVMQHAAREGARYAVAANSTTTTDIVGSTQTYVQQLMMGLDKTNSNYACSVFLADSSGNNINSGSTTATNATFGQRIGVQVQLTYTPITPGLFLPSSAFTFSTEACMISEGN